MINRERHSSLENYEFTCANNKNKQSNRTRMKKYVSCLILLNVHTSDTYFGNSIWKYHENGDLPETSTMSPGTNSLAFIL